MNEYVPSTDFLDSAVSSPVHSIVGYIDFLSSLHDIENDIHDIMVQTHQICSIIPRYLTE